MPLFLQSVKRRPVRDRQGDEVLIDADDRRIGDGAPRGGGREICGGLQNIGGIGAQRPGEGYRRTGGADGQGRLVCGQGNQGDLRPPGSGRGGDFLDGPEQVVIRRVRHRRAVIAPAVGRGIKA